MTYSTITSKTSRKNSYPIHTLSIQVEVAVKVNIKRKVKDKNYYIKSLDGETDKTKDLQ